jgi:predicted DNA binding CopG/RHH family protein
MFFIQMKTKKGISVLEKQSLGLSPYDLQSERIKSEYSVPVCGGREEKDMKKKTVYENADKNLSKAISVSERIEDFLPSPEQLIKKDAVEKITIALSEKSLEFFREAGKKTGVPYQQLIRKVLDTYAGHYSGA